MAPSTSNLFTGLMIFLPAHFCVLPSPMSERHQDSESFHVLMFVKQDKKNYQRHSVHCKLSNVFLYVFFLRIFSFFLSQTFTKILGDIPCSIEGNMQIAEGEF